MFMDMADELPREAVVEVAKVLKVQQKMCAQDFYFAED
jgi:hypothetical protein